MQPAPVPVQWRQPAAVRPIAALACALFTLSGTILGAQTLSNQPPASAALTPGAVALLTRELTPASIDTLRRALSDPDPVVRAVVARVAHVVRLRQLAPDIRAALEEETSQLAAVEHIRALLFIEGRAALDVVERHLPRAGADGARGYLEWLVLNDPARLPARLEEVVGPLERSRLGPLASALPQQMADDEIRRSLLRSWLRVVDGVALAGESHPWRIVLDRHGGATEEDATILLNALSSPDAAIRRETVWWIARRLAMGRPVPESVVEEIVAPTATTPSIDGETAWEAFGREVVARVRGKTPRFDGTPLIKAHAQRHAADAQAASVLGVLTSDEVEVLRASASDAASERGPTRPEPPANAARGMRTPDVLMWPGLLRTLLSSSGCRSTRAPRVGAIGVESTPDGQLRRLHVDIGSLPEDCRPALSALAHLTRRDPAHAAPDGLHWIALPVFDDFVACVADAAEDAAARQRPARVGAERTDSSPGKILPPKRVRHVNPVYPQPAQRAGVQGLVLIESMISRTGCPASAAVVQSVNRALDAAALAAVLQWRFTPTLLNQEPVPVVMTVSVNFTLQ